MGQFIVLHALKIDQTLLSLFLYQGIHSASFTLAMGLVSVSVEPNEAVHIGDFPHVTSQISDLSLFSL